MKKVKETLAGRAALFHLYPFSFAEVVGIHNIPLLTQIWQEKVITNKHVKQFNAIAPDTIRHAINIRNEHQTWGGYPPVWIRKTKEDRINWLKDYRKIYLDRSIFTVLYETIILKKGRRRDMNWRERITADPFVCHGKACISRTAY